MDETAYSLLMIQTKSDVTDEQIQAIQQAVGGESIVKDKREQRTAGMYFTFVSCIYGFLGILTLVTILNIVNSISMSVSSRIKQYGAMRAVGMGKTSGHKDDRGGSVHLRFVGVPYRLYSGNSFKQTDIRSDDRQSFRLCGLGLPISKSSRDSGFRPLRGVGGGLCPSKANAHDFDHRNDQRFISRISQLGLKDPRKDRKRWHRKSGATELETRTLNALLFP